MVLPLAFTWLPWRHYEGKSHAHLWGRRGKAVSGSEAVHNHPHHPTHRPIHPTHISVKPIHPSPLPCSPS